MGVEPACRAEAADFPHLTAGVDMGNLRGPDMSFVSVHVNWSYVSSTNAAWSMRRVAPSRATPTALTLGKLWMETSTRAQLPLRFRWFSIIVIGKVFRFFSSERWSAWHIWKRDRQLRNCYICIFSSRLLCRICSDDLFKHISQKEKKHIFSFEQCSESLFAARVLLKYNNSTLVLTLSIPVAIWSSS